MASLEQADKLRLPPHTLIYGESKTGKTRLYGRLAKTRKLVILDNEGSTRTLMSSENLDPEYRKNISVIRLPDTKIFPISAVTVRKIISMPPTTKFNFCDEHGNHNCPRCKKEMKSFTPFSLKDDVIAPGAILVIDTLSQLTSAYIEFIRAKDNRNLETNLNQLSLDNLATLDPLKDAEKLEWDDWAHLGNLCWEILKAIQAAPYEIIAVTHPVMAIYEDGTKRITPSMGTDKFSVKVANHFDNVIYSEFKLGKYSYQTVPSLNNAVCGSRDAIDISRVDATKHYSLLEPFHPKEK